MAKIPFDIKYRDKIESGEYRVETFLGYPVTIYRWDFDDSEQTPIMGSYVFEDGKEYVGAWNEEGHFDLMSPNDLDLFIITSEPELTEFEQAVEAIYESCSVKQLALKKKAAELLAIAIDANAKELYKGLKQSKLDKDSIPYHLIEFMCNLYTCRNWKEIEETAEAYVTRIKAAALKDLPRWKKCEHEMHTLTHLLIRSIDAMWIGESVKVGQYYIPTNDLILKLPGFNE